MPKGKRREPNDAYSRIVRWLKKQPRDRVFTSSDCASELSLKMDTVVVFLARRAKSGSLKNVSDTRKVAKYKIAHRNFSLQLSKGELSDALFFVLKDHSLMFTDRYFQERFLLSKVEEKLKKTVSLNSLHGVIHGWFEQEFLVRSPVLNGGYRLKARYLNLKERPLSLRRKSSKSTLTS